MPYLRTGTGKDAADIYYEVHGELAKGCGCADAPHLTVLCQCRTVWCAFLHVVACRGSLVLCGLRRALADPLEQEDDQRPSVVLIMGKHSASDSRASVDIVFISLASHCSRPCCCQAQVWFCVSVAC